MEQSILVIVESPTKARTIKRFLPKGYQVEASVGHIRDLPQSAADIPKKYKDEEWARLGIDVENGFAPLYVTPRGKSKIVNELKRRVREASLIYLATDEDREGESISWHLKNVLNPKVPVRRMVFHEITQSAITDALESYRDIDTNLVSAQETRRVLDRLYGYTLSPLLWKKIAYGLSAGRVQSPGLRLIVERERERMRFRSSSYWDVVAQLQKSDEPQPTFEARLTHVDDRRVAGTKDFDSTTGRLLDGRDVVLLQEADARSLAEKHRGLPWHVADTTTKDGTSRPAAPFVTATLQQEGNRKLGLSARDTMRIAQRLYEEGLITYMRTDSPTLSSEAIDAARAEVRERYGEAYLSPSPRRYTAKNGTAQEAHEAIRPAGTRFRSPDEVGLSGREARLYELIWKRTIASQMADAKKQTLTVSISVGDDRYTASGTRILFPGFLRVYVEGSDDPEAALEDREVLLPSLTKGDVLDPLSLEPKGHETKPPARYTEASLVQRLERDGIGRPSTYASIISVLYDRGYAWKSGNALVPTFTGFGVVQFLERYFNYLVDYGFTRDMERALDEVAAGKRDRLEYLTQFYLGKEGLKNRTEEQESSIDPSECRVIDVPLDLDGAKLRIGRYGPYIVHRESEGENVHVSIPQDVAPADLSKQFIAELVEIERRGPTPLGTDPETGLPVYCLAGRFGPYVQLGEQTEATPKPKRAGVPKGVNPSEVSLQDALKWLSVPRTLGVHPETGKEVVAATGRFGPFIVHDGDFRSLKKTDDVYTIDLKRALELLAEEKRGRGGRSRAVKDLGAHPKSGKKIAVYDGRYGMYIKYGTKNISLPEEYRDAAAVEKMTAEQAAAIVDAKTETSKGSKGKRGS